MPLNGRNILVVSNSTIQSDPRVRRQIDWLVDDGASVEVLGRGPQHRPDLVEHFEIGERGVIARLFCYFVLPFSHRERFLNSTGSLDLVIEKIASGYFSAVMLNDLDLAGRDELFLALASSNTPLVWDLHEYFPDLGGGIFWRISQTRYHQWLLEQVKGRQVNRFITVSQDIADLYQESFGSEFMVLTNSPQKSPSVDRQTQLFPSENTGKDLRLVYHGAIGKGRGLFRILRSLRGTSPAVSLTIIPMAAPFQLIRLKLAARLMLPSGKVTFLKPLAFDNLLPFLARFDAQILFYHPPHSTNELLALPNKFFESLAAGLAVVVGESPSMASIVRREKCGLVVQGWKADDLRKAINSLTPESIGAMKLSATLAWPKFSSDAMRERFLDLVAQILARS